MKRIILFLVLLIFISSVQAQEEPIIGWQFHDDNVTYLSEMIDLALKYNVNHVELSHNMVSRTEDILKSFKKQREINELIKKAHNNEIELFIWTHEISGLPEEFIVNGKTDLDNPLLWEWLKKKYENLFEVIPDVDGIILTFSETDIPVYEDEKVITKMSKAERVAKILNTVNEVVRAHNKILWARTWGEKVDLVAEGIRLTPEDIWVENKNVISDFDTYWPHHPLTGAYGTRPQIVEFDLNGQYLGRSWIPSAKPDYLKYRLQYAINKGVRGFVGRVGTLGYGWESTYGVLEIPNTHAINTPNEINLYAFSKIIQNPDIDTKDIWQEWVSTKYGNDATPYIVSAYNRTFEIARQLYKEAGVHQGNEDTGRICISTHSDIPWWGVFDVSRPEGDYWKRIYKDPVFKHVVNGGNLDEELNRRFDPIQSLCHQSINDIELAKPYLTQGQYYYLKEYLERELMAVQLFKEIKKILIRYGMVEIHNSIEDKELLDDDLQDLLVMADSIENKFGSEITLFKPDNIRIFVNGFTSPTDEEFLEQKSEEEITSKSNLWQKFLSFFKKIFRIKEKAEKEVVDYREFKTREDYKNFKAKEPEKWKIWCEKNPKECKQYEKPYEETGEYKESFIPDITHSGDLIIRGTEVIENKKYFQQGNVFIKDGAKLVIRNSQFMQDRGIIPTIHTNIIVDGELEIGNSVILPKDGLVTVSANGKVTITNSPTKIHLLTVFDGAQVTITNSEMIYNIGGLLQIHGGETKLVNSTIGAIGLTVPADAHLDISGLKSGACFDYWDVHDMIPDTNYDVILENSCILKDNFTGELEHGPYERGWLFFLDPNSHVKISDSELRKVFIDLKNEDVRFDNLKIGKPSSLKYRDIELNNITMMGQWPFTISNSNVTIINSNYLFLQPFRESTITLINSHMCEFIPRSFFGTIIFENVLWTDAGEIIGNEPTHSMANNFTIKGSVKIHPELRENLQWRDAQVTREYEVIIDDNNGNPLQGALVKIEGQELVSDEEGKAKFILTLNEFNYNKPHMIEITKNDKKLAEKEVDFFTDTPIVIK